jgi:Flp pilus assembly protein TadD
MPAKTWARRVGVAVAAVVVITAAGYGVSKWVRREPAADRQPPARDLVAAAVEHSPFLNTRPEVGYVGDAACAACHPAVARTYAEHPMGRSLAPVGPADLAPFPPFERNGFRFSAAVRGGQLVHKAERLDDRKQPVAAAESPIQYVLGSGTRGKSYLSDRGGCLYQSPVSWFTQTKEWDLSPGFHAFYPPEPPVEPGCLFCHANAARPVPHTRNRYEADPFRGLAVGCERCHGPGALHVAARQRGDAAEGQADKTIVNPRHLEPLLREGVCQQCHLQGEKRVVRRGRGPFDYRPGLPLHLFWSVFARPDAADRKRAVGHVEQMHQSRCFTASSGQLDCTSCHDPHRRPADAERTEFYRGRCLTCHGSKGCSLPAPERRAKADNCIACHMPRFQTSTIAHTAVTDHRVLRAPAAGQSAAPPPEAADDAPLENFFQKHLDPDDSTDRDLGLALVALARSPDGAETGAVDRAEPLLERATAADPADAEAWEGLGLVRAVRGNEAGAVAAWEAGLRVAPGREGTLSLLAQMQDRLGRRAEAAELTRRLLAVNPTNDRYWAFSARLAAGRQDWPAALRDAAKAVEVNPFNPESRRQLVECLARTGDRGRADAELETLVRLQPRAEARLRAWYAALPR